jgi:hypothetical protein
MQAITVHLRTSYPCISGSQTPDAAKCHMEAGGSWVVSVLLETSGSPGFGRAILCDPWSTVCARCPQVSDLRVTLQLLDLTVRPRCRKSSRKEEAGILALPSRDLTLLTGIVHMWTSLPGDLPASASSARALSLKVHAVGFSGPAAEASTQ